MWCISGIWSILRILSEQLALTYLSMTWSDSFYNYVIFNIRTLWQVYERAVKSVHRPGALHIVYMYVNVHCLQPNICIRFNNTRQSIFSFTHSNASNIRVTRQRTIFAFVVVKYICITVNQCVSYHTHLQLNIYDQKYNFIKI